MEYNRQWTMDKVKGTMNIYQSFYNNNAMPVYVTQLRVERHLPHPAFSRVLNGLDDGKADNLLPFLSVRHVYLRSSTYVKDLIG